MPANGTNALDALNWGTSSAGSAVAAESISTLGVDRTDFRVPVDQNHMWGAQVSAMKNLLLAMSTSFKSGCRLGVSTQTASPFAANEQGWWVDTSGNAKFSYGGVATTMMASPLGAKGDLITYTGAAIAVLAVGADGTLLTADSTQPNGIKWSTGGITWPLQNGTSGNTYNSAVTDSGSAVGHLFTTTNTFSTYGDFIAKFQSPSGTNWFTIGRLNSQNAFTLSGTADANGAGPVFVTSAAGNCGVTLDATGGGGRKFTTYSTTTSLWVLADLTASANRWQMDANGALAPFANNAVNLGLPTTNEMAAVYTVLTKSRHVAGLSAAPGIAAGTGAGTTPTVSMATNSTDLAGSINVTTGTGTPAVDATVVTITFAAAYGTAPWIVLTPANKATQALAVTVAPFVDVASTTTTTFIIKSNGTGLAISTAYKWFYTVIQ